MTYFSDKMVLLFCSYFSWLSLSIHRGVFEWSSCKSYLSQNLDEIKRVERILETQLYNFSPKFHKVETLEKYVSLSIIHSSFGLSAPVFKKEGEYTKYVFHEICKLVFDKEYDIELLNYITQVRCLGSDIQYLFESKLPQKDKLVLKNLHHYGHHAPQDKLDFIAFCRQNKLL